MACFLQVMKKALVVWSHLNCEAAMNQTGQSSAEWLAVAE